MSYYMTKEQSWFRIKQENVKKCEEALHDCYPKHREAKTPLHFIMRDMCWELIYEDDATWPDNKAVCDIEWHGDGYCDDELYFRPIAPFVEPGSYITMRGEDGTFWRWWFDGTKLEVQYGEIEFKPYDEDHISY